MEVPRELIWLSPLDLDHLDERIVGGRTIMLDPTRRISSSASNQSNIARQNYREARAAGESATEYQRILLEKSSGQKKHLNSMANNPDWGIRQQRGENTNYNLRMSIAGSNGLEYALFNIGL